MTGYYPALRNRARRPLQKIGDARSQLHTVQRTWASYVDSATVDCRPAVDLAEGVIEWTFTITPAPPSTQLERELRPVVSDARSCLDNTLTGIAQEQHVPPAKQRNLYMPYVQDASDWPKARARLRGLSREVVDRIHRLQPVSQPGAAAHLHPLVFLAGADNDNKHELGLTAALKPSSTAFLRQVSHGTFEIEPGLTAEQMAEFEAGMRRLVERPFKLTAWDHGDVVWRQQLPPYVTSAQFEPLDVELSLVIDTDPTGHSVPALPMLSDALDWAEGAVRFLAGLSDVVPVSTLIRRNPNAP